jgi:cytochrome c-type biogenesis protein
VTPSPEIGILLAFSAGVLSFLSPCILPLVPSYVSFITGLSLDDAERSRRTALIHALLFVLGFTLIFLALGATATVLGRLLKAYTVWITRAGGVLIIVFGLYMLGVLRIGAFAQERRMHIADKPLGYLGTVLVGIAFGAGWTPCLGPILGGILTYTASAADFSKGLPLLFAYSMGLAVPFVLAAVAIGRFFAVFERFRPYLPMVNKVAGVLLLLVGVLMLSGQFTLIASKLITFTPDWLLERL